MAFYSLQRWVFVGGFHRPNYLVFYAKEKKSEAGEKMKPIKSIYKHNSKEMFNKLHRVPFVIIPVVVYLAEILILCKCTLGKCWKIIWIIRYYFSFLWLAFMDVGNLNCPFMWSSWLMTHYVLVPCTYGKREPGNKYLAIVGVPTHLLHTCATLVYHANSSWV